MNLKKLYVVGILGFVCNLCADDFSKKVYIYMEDITAKIVDYKKSEVGNVEDIASSVRAKFMLEGSALIDDYGAFTGTPQNCYAAIMAVGSVRGLELTSLATNICQFVFDKNNGIGHAWQKTPDANPCATLREKSEKYQKNQEKGKYNPFGYLGTHWVYHDCRCEKHKGSHKPIQGIPVGIGLNVLCTNYVHALSNVVGGIKYTDVDGNSHGLVSCGGLSECDGVIIKGPC